MDGTQQVSTDNSSEFIMGITAEEVIALLSDEDRKVFDRLTEDIVEIKSKRKKFRDLVDKIKKINGGLQYRSGGEIDQLIEKEIGMKSCPNCSMLFTPRRWGTGSPHEEDGGGGMGFSWKCVKVKPKKYNRSGSLEYIENEIKWQARQIKQYKQKRIDFIYIKTGLKSCKRCERFVKQHGDSSPHHIGDSTSERWLCKKLTFNHN